MKKLLGLMALVAAMFAFTACGGGNSPKDVAEQAMKAVKDKDAKTLVDLFDTADFEEEGESVQEQKDMLVAMYQEKLDEMPQTNAVKSYETLSESIAEDGNTATVDMKIEYENGKTDTDVVKLKKDANGNWKLDMDK